MNTITYTKDHCYFHIRTNGIIGRGKSNLASNNVEDIDLPIVLFQLLQYFKGFQSVFTPINEISHSKEVLIYYKMYKKFEFEKGSRDRNEK